MARASTDIAIHFWEGEIGFTSHNTDTYESGRQSISLTFAGSGVTFFFPADRRKDIASILFRAARAVLANETKDETIPEPERVAEAA